MKRFSIERLAEQFKVGERGSGATNVKSITAKWDRSALTTITEDFLSRKREERRGESTSAGGRIRWKGGCTHCHTRSLWFYFSGHRKSVTPDLAGRFRDGVDWRTVIPMVVFSLWNSAPKAKNMTGQRITRQQKQVEISWNFIKYLTIPFILLPPLLFYCHFKVVHTYQERQ